MKKKERWNFSKRNGERLRYEREKKNRENKREKANEWMKRMGEVKKIGVTLNNQQLISQRITTKFKRIAIKSIRQGSI